MRLLYVRSGEDIKLSSDEELFIGDIYPQIEYALTSGQSGTDPDSIINLDLIIENNEASSFYNLSIWLEQIDSEQFEDIFEWFKISPDGTTWKSFGTPDSDGNSGTEAFPFILNSDYDNILDESELKSGERTRVYIQITIPVTITPDLDMGVNIVDTIDYLNILPELKTIRLKVGKLDYTPDEV